MSLPVTKRLKRGICVDKPPKTKETSLQFVPCLYKSNGQHLTQKCFLNIKQGKKDAVYADIKNNNYNFAALNSLTSTSQNHEFPQSS